MTQFNTLNVTLSNWQLNKSKSGKKNGIEVTLKLSSNSCDKTNFSHKLLLTNTQVSRLRKAFANNSSANINYQKSNCRK